MPRKNPDNLFDLPSLELQCMKALWSLGQATVEDIRAALMARRPLAYTTIMTVMDRLARKGLVERVKRGRAHLYTSAVTEETIRDHAVGRLVENFFDGSQENLRVHLASPGTAKPPAPRRTPAPPPPTTRQKTRTARPKREQDGLPPESIDPALL